MFVYNGYVPFYVGILGYSYCVYFLVKGEKYKAGVEYQLYLYLAFPSLSRESVDRKTTYFNVSRPHSLSFVGLTFLNLPAH